MAVTSIFAQEANVTIGATSGASSVNAILVDKLRLPVHCADMCNEEMK